MITCPLCKFQFERDEFREHLETHHNITLEQLIEMLKQHNKKSTAEGLEYLFF